MSVRPYGICRYKFVILKFNQDGKLKPHQCPCEGADCHFWDAVRKCCSERSAVEAYNNLNKTIGELKQVVDSIDATIKTVKTP